MKKLVFATLSSVCIWALQGCTTTPEQCDPHVELNVLNKAACSFSGSYDKRVEQKEKLLLDEKATNVQLNSAYASIKKIQMGQNTSIAQKRAQLNSLNKSILGMTAQLKQKAKGRTNLLKQIDEVEQQMKKVNNADSNDSELEKQLELQQLQRKLSKLQAALGM